MDLKQIQKQAEKDIKQAKTLTELNGVYKQYLGKKGKVSEVFAYFKGFSDEEKKNLGKEANLVKVSLGEMLEQKTQEVKNKEINESIKNEKIDISKPGEKIEMGHLHPITLATRKAIEIFTAMGFEVASGPEIESEWYNFDALNIPKNHPARDMQDTFYLGQKNKKGEDLVLRTHTSPVQVRYMESHKPPFKIIAPGRVFRNEATDASHEAQFTQLEGLMVGEDISAANFKAIIEEFLKRFFNREVKIRLRPGYFPFVEPGFEIDAQDEKGNWLELMGAGMVHKNVFKAAGLNPKQVTGFAFGVGLGRLAMIKHKIPDLRMLYQGDLRFLKQF